MEHCRTFIHLHVPRTAGTTLREALFSDFVRCFAPDQVFLVGLESDIYRTGSNDDLQALTPRARQRLRLIIGHVAPSVANLVRNPLTFTVLREPVDRCLSAYWYCYHNPQHPAHKLARHMTPLEFVAAGWGEAKNGQARYLSGHFFAGETAGDDEIYESARKALDGVSYVGFFQNLRGVVDDICAAAGVRPPARLPRVNSAPREQLSRSDLARLVALNSVDVALYEYALRRWGSVGFETIERRSVSIAMS